MNFLTKSRCAAALFASAALTMPALAIAQEGSPMNEQASEQTALEMRADQIIEMINGEAKPEDIFTDGFLAAVPISQLNAISQQFTSQFGAAISVEALDPPSGTRAALAIRMERAIARGGIAIDASDDNRVSELLFQSFEPTDDSPEKIVADLTSLPGSVSAWFGPLDGGEPTIAINEAEQMPLGSTFKLYVLAALARDIAEGNRSWDDVIALDTQSFPSGMLQDWPEGAPVTLQTLASMMISISDNTATDQLIIALGRDQMLQTVIASGHSEPAYNDPFMTTREMFLLKGGPASRLEDYAVVDIESRTAILDEIESVDVSVNQIQAAFAGGPIELDVEWFGNAADLASLFRYMRETADPLAFEIMAINPSISPTARDQWSYVGYKGGSEPGVLNLTWLLTDEEGRDHALVLSWSNPNANLDQTALELIAQRILALER